VIRDGANYGAVFAEIAGSPFITLGSTVGLYFIECDCHCVGSEGRD